MRPTNSPKHATFDQQSHYNPLAQRSNRTDDALYLCLSRTACRTRPCRLTGRVI